MLTQRELEKETDKYIKMIERRCKAERDYERAKIKQYVKRMRKRLNEVCDVK